MSWPGLRGSAERVTFTPEQGVWGKAHNVATDYRWLATTPGIPAVSTRLVELCSVGAEDEPRGALCWRQDAVLGSVCMRLYGSRARDSSDRPGVLEKQILVAPTANPALMAAALLPFVATLDATVWWDRRLDPRWSQPDFALALESQPLETTTASRAALLAEAGRKWWLTNVGATRLARLVAGLRGQRSALFLSQVTVPPTPEAILTLLAALPPSEASRISFLGALFSGRTRASSLDWTIVCCSVAPTDASPLPEVGPEAVSAAERFLAGQEDALGTIPASVQLPGGAPTELGRQRRIEPSRTGDPLEGMSQAQIVANLAMVESHPGFRDSVLRRLPSFLDEQRRAWTSWPEVAEGVETILGWVDRPRARTLLVREGWRCLAARSVRLFLDGSRLTTSKIAQAVDLSGTEPSSVARLAWLAALIDAGHVFDTVWGPQLIAPLSTDQRWVVTEALKATGQWRDPVKRERTGFVETKVEPERILVFRTVDGRLSGSQGVIRSQERDRLRCVVLVTCPMDPLVLPPAERRAPLLYLPYLEFFANLPHPLDRLSPEAALDLVEKTRLRCTSGQPDAGERDQVSRALGTWYRLSQNSAIKQALHKELSEGWGLRFEPVLTRVANAVLGFLPSDPLRGTSSPADASGAASGPYGSGTWAQKGSSMTEVPDPGQTSTPATATPERRPTPTSDVPHVEPRPVREPRPERKSKWESAVGWERRSVADTQDTTVQSPVAEEPTRTTERVVDDPVVSVEDEDLEEVVPLDGPPEGTEPSADTGEAGSQESSLAREQSDRSSRVALDADVPASEEPEPEARGASTDHSVEEPPVGRSDQADPQQVGSTPWEAWSASDEGRTDTSSTAAGAASEGVVTAGVDPSFHPITQGAEADIAPPPLEPALNLGTEQGTAGASPEAPPADLPAQDREATTHGVAEEPKLPHLTPQPTLIPLDKPPYGEVSEAVVVRVSEVVRTLASHGHPPGPADWSALEEVLEGEGPLPEWFRDTLLQLLDPSRR